jgi:anti-anti-sigma factor
MPKQTVEFSFRCNIAVAAVVEEIDISNARLFEEQLTALASNARRFVVSLILCNYIDSSGLRVLIHLSKRRDVEFGVAAPPGTQTRRIIDIAGLCEQLNVFDSLEEALAKVGTGAMIGAD